MTARPTGTGHSAIRQIPNEWSAAGFLSKVKTFPWLFDLFASPAILPVVNVLVPWRHLLIGLSLILGLFTRVGAVAGAFLMIMYREVRLFHSDHCLSMLCETSQLCRRGTTSALGKPHSRVLDDLKRTFSETRTGT